MILSEIEALHKLISASKKVLEYSSPEEQDHFEETCDLEKELGEETYEEILRIAQENEQEDHIYVQLCQIEDALVALEPLLNYWMVSHPLLKYSNYFSNLEEK
jgi:hypothetical protein